jgi:arsenate reductase
MAEGFLRDLAGDRFEAASAGYEPASEICAEAVAAMAEIGTDISGQRPKPMDGFIRQHIAYAITPCDRETESGCPIYPGVVWRLTWPLADPHRVEGSAERLAAVRDVRDEIRRRVMEFVSEQASESKGMKRYGTEGNR